MKVNTLLVWFVLAALTAGCSSTVPQKPANDGSDSNNEISRLQQDIAASIADTASAASDVAFSVSSVEQILVIELHNFRPLEDTGYLLVDCAVTVIADDERGLVLDQVRHLEFQEQEALTIPVPAPTTLSGG